MAAIQECWSSTHPTFLDVESVVVRPLTCVIHASERVDFCGTLYIIVVTQGLFDYRIRIMIHIESGFGFTWQLE